MENKKTPQPGSAEYDVNKTEELNTPKYNSTSERRESHELPAVEHFDEHPVQDLDSETVQNTPNPDLGNKREGDEEDREKIITP